MALAANLSSRVPLRMLPRVLCKLVQLHVIPIPVPRHELSPRLVRGEGDIAAAELQGEQARAAARKAAGQT